MNRFDNHRTGPHPTERELTEPVDLSLPDGRVNPDAIGWSRQPVQHCALPKHWGRRKRWDYWCVTTDSFLVSLVVADLDYLGLTSAWFHDFETGLSLERPAPTPFGLGVAQPDTVAGSDIRWDRLGLRVEILEQDGATRLRTAFRMKGHTVEADLTVAMPPGHETLSVTVPWSDTRYQFTSKHVARPATGTVVIDGVERSVGPDNHGYGTLDYGRGVWPYRNVWNWAAASGPQGDRIVGLQFGGKWTDGTPSTENAVVVDGHLTKISEDLVWEYDRSDFTRPWRLHTASGSVDVRLAPIYERASKANAGILSTDVHQCFGHFDGTVVTDDGEIDVQDLLGWAEEARWRW